MSDRLRSGLTTTAGMLLATALLAGIVCMCPVDPRSTEGILFILYSLGVGLTVGLLIGWLGGPRAEQAGQAAAFGVAIIGALLFFLGSELFDALRIVVVGAPSLAMSSGWLARRRNAPRAP